jgi:hypothetical protein
LSGGFYKRRRGILEHLESGTIGLLDLAIHDYLNLRANLLIGSGCSTPPGVCFSSAVAIHALCTTEISERTVRRSLEHLERIGWIKRWPIRGKRGNYPILVCRASVHDLSGIEYRVNGLETTNWRNPVLIPAALCPHFSPSLSGSREVESGERRKPLTPSVSVLPSDSLEQETKDAAFSVFWDRWPRKGAKSAAIRAWTKIPVAEYPPLMVGLERWLLSDQWTRGVIPHPATWLNGKRWQDEDIPQFSVKEGTNGKPTATDLAIRNARALGLERPN